MKASKAVVYRKNTQNQKQCSKWPSPALTQAERWRRHTWRTAAAMTAWSSLAHSVLMWCSRDRRDQWCVFCTTSLAVYSTCCSPPDLNLVNLKATVAAQMNWHFSFFSWKRHFDDVKLTSSLHSVVQVMMALYNFFSVTLNVEMNCARNYENMLKFVKVTPKILLVPFFRTRCS